MLTAIIYAGNSVTIDQLQEIHTAW